MEQTFFSEKIRVFKYCQEKSFISLDTSFCYIDYILRFVQMILKILKREKQKRKNEQRDASTVIITQVA